MSKLIKFRQGFINSDCLEGIMPDRNGEGYAIFTVGHVIAAKVTEEELADVMAQMEEALKEEELWLS